MKTVNPQPNDEIWPALWWRCLNRPMAIAVTLAVCLAGCGIRRGHISVQRPKVFSNQTSRNALKAQAAAVKKAAASHTSSTGVHQGYSVREAQALNLRAGYTGMAPAPPVDDPDESTESETTASAPPDAPATVALPGAAITLPGTPISLFSETLEDFSHTNAALSGLQLLYQGDIVATGALARLYLVRFDIWVEAERQDYFTYPYRMFDIFHGLRNYTKDYNAEVHFVLPEIGDPDVGESLLQVYAVQPVSENIRALEGLSSASQLGLAAAYTEAQWAAAMDYSRNREEQFAELRKYPVVRGVIDSPTRFRYIIAPRRRITERSALLSWIPGVSKYKISRLLEPQTHSVYAYLLVTDTDAFADALTDDNVQHRELIRTISQVPGYYFSRLGVGYRGTLRGPHSDTNRPPPASKNGRGIQRLQYEQIPRPPLEGDDPNDSSENPTRPRSGRPDLLQCSLADDGQVAQIPLSMFANYKEFGDPRKHVLLPIRGRYPEPLAPAASPMDDRDFDIRVVRLGLPLYASGDMDPEPVGAIDSFAMLTIKWAGRDLSRARVALVTRGKDKAGNILNAVWGTSLAPLCGVTPTKILMRSATRSTLSEARYSIPDFKTGDGQVLSLCVQEASGTQAISSRFRYKPSSTPKLAMSQSSGATGQLLKISIPKIVASKTVIAVAATRFGGNIAPYVVGPKAAPKGGPWSATVRVPEAQSHRVAVTTTVMLKDSKGGRATKTLEFGDFQFMGFPPK